MRKFLLTGAVMLLTASGGMAQGKYQIGNSDFETTWVNKNEPGNGWNSFVSATGTESGFSGTSASTTSKITGGINGSSTAVMLKSKNLVVAYANGNLTTGVINMGSKTPSNESNYNFTNRADATHSCLFAGRPDSVAFYAKYKPSKTGIVGQGSFILHGDIDYKDPYETAENKAAYEVANTLVTIPPTSVWTRFSKAFQYFQCDSLTAKNYMLASFTTNPNPGGSYNDELSLDDVAFVYNSSLSTIIVGSDTLAAFAKDKYSYVVNQLYKDSCVTFTADGVGAEATGSYDSETGVYTIVVNGDDISVNPENTHTYTIQFFTSETTFTDILVVTIDDQSLPGQQQDLKKALVEGASTCELSINNFSLSMGEDVLTVGDIVLPGVEMAVGENDTIVYNTTQNILITSSTPGAIGPILGEVPVVLSGKSIGDKMIAYIDIDMTAMLGQVIRVTFGVEPPVALSEVTFTDDLIVTIDGQSLPAQQQELKKVFAEDANTCELSINNFSLGAGEDVLTVGDIVLPGVEMTMGENDTIVYNTTQNILITSSTPGAIGPMLGEVPVVLTGKSIGDKMIAYIDIDMTAMLGQVIRVTFGVEPPVALSEVTFTDNLIVTVDGQSLPGQQQELKKVFAEGASTCELSINNFSLGAGEDVLTVGDIVLPGVEMTMGENDTIVYNTTQSILITSSIPGAIGPILGEVPVVLSGKSIGDKMIAYIDIDMTTMLGQVIRVTFGIDDVVSVDGVLKEEKGVPATVYTLSGVAVKTHGSLKNLPKDIYIINGKAVRIK